MKNAVIDTATGYVKRWGFTDFTADGNFDGVTETQVALNDEAVPVADIPLHYNKIVGGDFVEMTQPEKDAVDAVMPTNGVQRINAMAEQTISGSAFQSVFGGVWTPRPLKAGEYVLAVTFEMKLDSAAVWGASGPSKSAQMQLELNGAEIQQWLWPHDRYNGHAFIAGRAFVEGAQPTFNLLARALATGSQDIQVRNARMQIQPAAPPQVETDV